MPRMSKTAIAVGLLTLMVLFGACRESEPQSGTGRADVVILVTVDGLVPSELRLFGGDIDMPALERVAAQGRAWDDAWTAAPMTRPGVATYLTGLAPDRHRVRDDLFTSLDEDQPTLATAFAEAGYRTAAFPDSSFLGASSGLLRGFDVVAHPPMALINPARWHPSLLAPNDVAETFNEWLVSLPQGTRYFAWVHFSGPLARQLWELGSEAGLTPPLKKKQALRQNKEDYLPPGIERLDEALAMMLDGLEQHGDLDDALIVVAGTQADATGGGDDLAGPGFSVGPSAVGVPVILGWPGATEIRGHEQPVWAPDVAATIAEAAGLGLSDDAEGISLLDGVPADRIVFAWAWASLDQMGWRAQRVARSGSILRVEGPETLNLSLAEPEAEVAESDVARLTAALAARAEPAAPAVPLELVRPLLEGRGLVLRPVPSEGREFGDAVTRREVTVTLLGARSMAGRGYGRLGTRRFEEVLAIDPENLVASLRVGPIVAGGRGDHRADPPVQAPGRRRALRSGLHA